MLGTTLSTAFDSLVAILAPYVQKCIHEVTTAMAALRNVEGRQREVGGRSVCAVVPGPLRTKKKKKERPYSGSRSGYQNANVD